MSDLSHPAAVMARLQEIESDLALRQNFLEQAALDWFRAKRDKEKKWAQTFLDPNIADECKTIAERKAVADAETADTGRDAEAEFESLKAVVRVLDTRAAIGMAILKAQGRS